MSEKKKLTSKEVRAIINAGGTQATMVNISKASGILLLAAGFGFIAVGVKFTDLGLCLAGLYLMASGFNLIQVTNAYEKLRSFLVKV